MSGPFDVLMVDPPWPVRKIVRQVRPRQTAEMPYSTLDSSGCFRVLDSAVFPLAAERHVVFLWTTEAYLDAAEQEMKGRGYRRHVRFIWDKGNGPAAWLVRYTHEYCVWWSRGGLLPIAPEQRCRFGTVLHAPPRQHSRKPSAAYALVEALYPDARRLDVFSREYRPGWSAFGDQVDHFTPLLAPLREVGHAF